MLFLLFVVLFALFVLVARMCVPPASVQKGRGKLRDDWTKDVNTPDDDDDEGEANVLDK